MMSPLHIHKSSNEKIYFRIADTEILTFAEYEEKYLFQFLRKQDSHNMVLAKMLAVLAKHFENKTLTFKRLSKTIYVKRESLFACKIISLQLTSIECKFCEKAEKIILSFHLN
jgi:hypothetical protein